MVGACVFDQPGNRTGSAGSSAPSVDAGGQEGMEESGRAHAQAGGGGGEASRKSKRAAAGGTGSGDGERGKQGKGMGSAGGSRREGSDGDVGGGVGEEGRGGELPGVCDAGFCWLCAEGSVMRMLIVIVFD